MATTLTTRWTGYQTLHRWRGHLAGSTTTRPYRRFIRHLTVLNARLGVKVVVNLRLPAGLSPAVQSPVSLAHAIREPLPCPMRTLQNGNPAFIGLGQSRDPEIDMLLQDPVPDPVETLAISPYLEMGAYEELWHRKGTTFKSLASILTLPSGRFPSQLVPQEKADASAAKTRSYLASAGVVNFGVAVNGTADYPKRLNDAVSPVALLYYQGWWNFTESPCVAVVGSRKPSPEGIARTRRLVRLLVNDEFTIVSGLAAGIDYTAHTTALDAKGLTIAVLGTPLSRTYPRENAELQKRIAETCLVISQVPVRRYESRDWRWNRRFFPERNKTMSALSKATIIVEAGEISGTLIHARAALRQNRKLFILDNCFRNPGLTWPARFEAKGAIRVREYDDIRRHLSA